MAVVDAAAHGAPTPGRLPDGVLIALLALIPCDTAAFVDIDIATATHFVEDVVFDAKVGHSLTQPRSDSPEEPFWRHYPTSLPCSYPTSTGDDMSVTQLSDFYSVRQWHATPMYVDAFSENGYDHELMCPLPTVGSRSRRLLFFRRGGRDFTEDDRSVMTLLRPHLVDIYARQATEAWLGSLTPRQVEVLRLVGAGHSNGDVAAILCVSALTVRKHLENIYERLEVTNRSAAVARVFPPA